MSQRMGTGKISVAVSIKLPEECSKYSPKLRSEEESSIKYQGMRHEKVQDLRRYVVALNDDQLSTFDVCRGSTTFVV